MLRKGIISNSSRNLLCTYRRFTANAVSTPIFPWRSSNVMLDRLETPNDLSGSPDQDAIGLWKRTSMVGRHFRYSWLELLIGSWKQPVAKDMGWAFQKGLAGLLSRVLSVPMTKIDKGIAGIDLDTTSPKIESLGNWTEEEDKDAKDFIDGTLEERLRSKYNSIDPKIHDVRFSCKPISYEVEYGHVVPIITREVVAKDPHLLELYQDFIGGSYSDIQEKFKRLLERAKNGDATFTLVVDVSVQCLERFYIADKETGDIIQGSNTEEEVCHLVRFENTVRQDEKHPFGDWIITDWDDLLEGNVWYIKEDVTSNKSTKQQEL